MSLGPRKGGKKKGELRYNSQFERKGDALFQKKEKGGKKTEGGESRPRRGTIFFPEEEKKSPQRRGDSTRQLRLGEVRRGPR